MKVTVTAAEYNAFVRVCQKAELITLQMQRELVPALADRKAAYAALAQAYGLPPTFAALTWHDETYEIDVTPPQETPPRTETP
jgi:hypothetical protein